MKDPQDRVVIVTGAAGNLGAAVAAGLAGSGARRVLVDRGRGRLEKAYPDAPRSHTLLVGETDLADAGQAQRMVERTIEAFGRIDVLINTVGGYAGGQAVHEEELDIWERMLRINLHTTLNACRAAIPFMLRAGGGRIVNVGARAGLSGVATLGAYSAAKSAVIRLTESLAGELKDRGITVNCVLPGTIDTPQNRRDMPGADHARWVPPPALADAILFLASDAARAVTGVALPVYGRS